MMTLVYTCLTDRIAAAGNKHSACVHTGMKCPTYDKDLWQRATPLHSLHTGPTTDSIDTSSVPTCNEGRAIKTVLLVILILSVAVEEISPAHIITHTHTQ